MKVVVLDTSVVAKWFVRADEADLDAADRVRARVVRDPERFVVPTLFAYELLATLCRRLRAASEVDACLMVWLSLGVREVACDETLLRAAAELAARHGVTGYDAAYLAVAQQLHGVWYTCDRPAWRRVGRTRLAELVADA